MALFNSAKTRVWSKSTPADGDLIDEEVDRQYENDQYLKDRIDLAESNFLATQIPLGGIIEDNLNITSTSNFKDANGQSISRTSFSALWNLVKRSITGIVPVTDRISCTNHGCIEGQLVKFSFTGGGITALVNYYVRNPTTNDFQVSSASTGSILDLTSSQTGEMIINIEYGFGDGSTTFNVPDRRGIFPRGAGIHGTRAKAAGGNYDGGSIGFAGQDQFQEHAHFVQNGFPNNYTPGPTGGSGVVGTINKAITDYAMAYGSNGTPRVGNETTPAYVAVKYKVRVL
ncbi:phage tail collar domain protein [Leptospira kirschneri serovar Bim str. 1051]|uniref:phage tail protein n=1 Tax=Leptospira kirschneri TaxID=29507 RepID=UPI0002896E42|nr:phage tail protein [Leptospira kirschneri]EMK15601.1 phage tail collar domain protein [Leptospira kirschneri serovar Bim str. PUO 1247]EMN02978.1 phage tail collar domain protein [Leptospira kirschneri serovar Bim str. 1051]